MSVVFFTLLEHSVSFVFYIAGTQKRVVKYWGWQKKLSGRKAILFLSCTFKRRGLMLLMQFLLFQEYEEPVYSYSTYPGRR